MPKDIFHERARGEEDAYFRRQDAELIAKLRQKAKFSEIAHALAEKLNADEPALLERIQKLGVSLDTGSAFILAPLVEVAWADGDVSNAERNKILHIAEQRGVTPDSADYRQLIDWLDQRPSEEVIETSLEAIRIGLSVLPHDEAEKRIASMIKACEEVAQAAGGIAQLFWLDGVSHAESTVIAAIRDHLQGKKAGVTRADPATPEV